MLQARNDRPLAALFDISRGSEVGKKERRRSVKCLLEGMEFTKNHEEKGERATQDHFQHQAQASYLCMHAYKHTVSTMHSHQTQTSIHKCIHCEYNTHRSTYYTHTNFRPLYTCTRTCMFSYEHTHIQIHTVHSNKTQASTHNIHNTQM